MPTVKRYDKLELPGSIKRTDEGFIAADPVVTRTGVFKYQMPGGEVRLELRTPEEVFKTDSMATARMIPITNTHPEKFVTSEDVGELGIGTTGENVRRDDDTMRVPVKITRKDGVDAVENGRHQLSLAYTCSVERKDGEYRGEKFTHVQSNIRYNHLALCDTARAGPGATLRLDAEDAVMVETGQDKSGLRKETKAMPDLVKLRLDSTGLGYDVPPEVDAAYKTLVTERTDAVEKLTAETKAKDELQAKHDALTEEHEKLKKLDNADAITAGVKARSDLLAKVVPMLSEEDAKKADAMTDAELRIAGIASQVEKFDGKDADGKELSADYIAARLDAASEAFEKSDKAKREDGKTVIGDGSGHKDAKDLADSRQKMQDRRDGKAEDKDKGKK